MAQVKIILREDVHGLGHAGTVVSVRPGYARNFLLPEGKAVLATEAGVKELEHHQPSGPRLPTSLIGPGPRGRTQKL